MNADGSEVERLTDSDAWDESPAWSPDGQPIAFDSERDGRPEIYVMSADGEPVESTPSTIGGPDGDCRVGITLRPRG